MNHLKLLRIDRAPGRGRRQRGQTPGSDPFRQVWPSGARKSPEMPGVSQEGLTPGSDPFAVESPRFGQTIRCESTETASDRARTWARPAEKASDPRVRPFPASVAV